MKWRFCFICALAALAGCATAPRESSLAQWAAGHGGELHDARLARIAAIGDAIPSGLATPVQFHVLNSRGLTAFSWRSGDVYLSSGLIDAASDDEIAAAIAHEMGHLRNDAHVPGAVALGGGSDSLTIEEAADRQGVQLLRAAGRPPESLVSLLDKVIAGSASGPLKDEMRTRVSAIRTDLSRGN